MAAAPLTLDSLVVASQSQVSSDLAGETVLLNLDTAQYHGLDAVGSFVWSQLGAPIPLRTLCDRVEARYDAPRDRVEADVLAFVKACLERGLVEVRGGA